MNKRKSLGQHFLISESIAKSIVNFAKIKKDDIVIEIGTGKGILTPYLCAKAKKVISIEKDEKLYLEAKERFSNITNLALECGDAFKTRHEFTVLVSNLPYSESRKAIEWLTQRRFERAVIMVQKEFAQKLGIEAGKERRAISLLASYCLTIENFMQVSKINFSPRPKVDSVVIGITQKQQIQADLVRAVNRLFSFKRKTVRQIGKKIGINLNSEKRLEEIPTGEIIEIAKRAT